MSSLTNAVSDQRTKDVLGDFHVLDFVKVFFLIPDFVGVSEKRPHQTFVQGFECNDVLPAGEDHAADSDHVHAADSFPDDRKSVVPNFSIRDQIVGTDEVAGIYVGPRHELVDVDRAGGFQGDVLELVFRHIDEVSVSTL